MSRTLSAQARAALRCPACCGELAEAGERLRCRTCAASYEARAGQPIDLRPKSPLRVPLEVEVGPPHAALERWTALEPFPSRSGAGVPRRGVRHLSPEMVSWLPEASTEGALSLDLGCGKSLHRQILERRGFEVVGVDAYHPSASLLGDAHRLPLADSTFELVLCVAALEHLAHPLLALQEAARVLEPGGLLLGSVAFLEPYHGESYYHHSHRAVAHGLLHAGLAIEALGYNRGYTAPYSLRRALFWPRWPRLSALAVAPLAWASRGWWRANAFVQRRPELVHVARRNLAGSFVFAARRPEPDDG